MVDDMAKYSMRETVTAVYFWGGPLSQWFPSRFDERLVADGERLAFNTAEQYMMAAKAHLFGDREALAQILRETNPRRQKAIGRRVRGFDAEAWNVAAPDVLVRANLAKFAQNTDLGDYLASTAGKRLVEGSPVDCIYGVGLSYDDPLIEAETNWRGLNLLGNALEHVRARLFPTQD